MEVSQQDLIEIVEKASTLTERLGKRFIPDEENVNSQLISSRWQAWCQGAAKGNLEKFAKRLVWDSVDSSAVSTLLGEVRLAEPKNLPIWTEILREVLNTDWEIAYVSTCRCLDTEKPIPFEELYLSFIYVARQKLIVQVGFSWQLLSEAVQIRMERQLLVQLASLCAQSLELEFSLFKALKQSTFTLLQGQQQDLGSNQQYQIFINDQKTSKLLSFFQKYSVLARFAATAINFWVEEKAEFLQRLASDKLTIQQIFQQDTGQVVAVQLNLSDLHNKGRSVIGLTFASGLKLIYKPRGLGLETAYFQLLSWCNQQDVLLPFKILKVIDCTTYGWMEYVEHLPCADEAAAQRYYQRGGMLLCLVYVLQGNDCHSENLIANGEHPVLVDPETLLHPEAREIDPKIDKLGAQYLVDQQLFDSVLRTGLLPRWKLGSAGKFIDDSGLGGVGEEILVRKQKWRNINTDNMAVEYESDILPTQPSTTFLNGIILSANDYVDDIVDGFRQMYQFLAQRREALLATDSPLAALAHQKIRFLFRNTQIYGDVQHKALQPNFLQHSVDRSIKLDVLSRALLVTERKPLTWPLLAVELQGLEQMDTPYFVADSSSDALKVKSDLVIEGYFKEPAYNQMISRLQQLNDADLTQQIAIIRASLYSRVAVGTINVAPTDCASAALDLNATAPLTRTQLVQEAVEIAKELQQRAIHAVGSVAWIGMEYLPGAERMQLQPLGYNLYDGVCGIALFLAALAKITGDVGFRDLALSALQDLRKDLLDTDPNSLRKITKQMGIGAGSGLGSIIYTLVRVSQFLDEPELLDIASLAASLITPEKIVSDHQFDTIAGAAGAILGLLTLYKAKSDPSVLKKACACGYHLLDNRVASESGFRAWATLEGQLATGLSHGASGIAYALLRLYKKAQEPAFLEAASEAIAYVRSVFSQKAGNWPVSTFARSRDKCGFMVNWCHGAPGIGLAHLGGLEILDDAEIKQEIAVALSTTQQFGLQNLDQLCCGNFGRVEALLVASQKLSRPELWESAQKQAAQIVTLKKQLGAFCLFPELPKDVYNPGFFRGTAGIGYQLLRLAYPESLPSVLLWE